MADLILYSNKMSRGRIVHWMLEELDIPYEIEWIAFGSQMKSPAYREINPMGKVPALKHGQAIVTETPAILTYLANTFEDKGLIPLQGSPERAAFFRWMFFIAGPLETATTAKFMGWSAPDTTPLGTSAKGFLGFGSLETTLLTVENHLKAHTYVCGEQFTAADIYLASHLGYSMMVSKTIDPRPTFVEYLKRLNQRPAKIRVDMASS
jgi:glutathione S-transferase